MKTFNCQICEKKFRSYLTLKNHLRNRHKTNNNFQMKPAGTKVCQLCGYEAKSPSNLTIHVLSHTGEKPYSCNGCGVKIKSKHYMNKHIELSCPATKRPFPCSYEFRCTQCAQTFKTSNARSNHELTHGDKHLCSYCQTRFQSLKSLIHHKYVMHSASVCFICDLDFPTKNLLRLHIEELHIVYETVKKNPNSLLPNPPVSNQPGHSQVMRNLANSPNSVNVDSNCSELNAVKGGPTDGIETQSYSCMLDTSGNFVTEPVTDLVTEPTPSERTDKPTAEAVIKFYRCETCGYKCRAIYSLRKHKLQNNCVATLARCMECKICGIFLDNESALIAHQILQHGIKFGSKNIPIKKSSTFEANSFSTFSYNIDEVQDESLNINMKKFHCPLMACTSTFNTVEELASHKFKKHFIKTVPTFECLHCSSKFWSVESLSSHIQTKHPSKPQLKVLQINNSTGEAAELRIMPVRNIEYVTVSNTESQSKGAETQLKNSSTSELPPHTYSKDDIEIIDPTKDFQKSQHFSVPKPSAITSHDTTRTKERLTIHSETNDPFKTMPIGRFQNSSKDNIDKMEHEKLHIDEFECPLCLLSFGTNDDLTKHKVTSHLPTKTASVYECSDCNLVFWTADSLKIHTGHHDTLKHARGTLRIFRKTASDLIDPLSIPDSQTTCQVADEDIQKTQNSSKQIQCEGQQTGSTKTPIRIFQRTPKVPPNSFILPFLQTRDQTADADITKIVNLSTPMQRQGQKTGSKAKVNKFKLQTVVSNPLAITGRSRSRKSQHDGVKLYSMFDDPILQSSSRDNSAILSKKRRKQVDPILNWIQKTTNCDPMSVPSLIDYNFSPADVIPTTVIKMEP